MNIEQEYKQNMNRSIKAFIVVVGTIVVAMVSLLLFEIKKSENKIDNIISSQNEIKSLDSTAIKRGEENNQKFYSDYVLYKQEDFCSCAKEFTYKHMSKGCKK